MSLKAWSMSLKMLSMAAKEVHLCSVFPAEYLGMSQHLRRRVPTG